MKRFLITIKILILIFFINSILFANSIPAPFSKAREMAIPVPSSDGKLYYWKAEFQKNGELNLYEINVVEGNSSLCDQIILSKNRRVAVGYVYSGEGSPYYTFWTSETGLIRHVHQEKAIQAAFLFFKELVDNKLI